MTLTQTHTKKAKRTFGSFADMDNQSYFKRVRLAALPLFSLCFMLFFHGPLDIAIKNSDELIFRVVDVAPTMGIICLLIFAAVLFLFSLIKGKIFNILLITLPGLSLAVFVQGYLIIGNEIGNISHKSSNTSLLLTITNLLMWALIVAFPFILAEMSKKALRLMLVFLPLLLVLIQLIGIVSVIIEKLSSQGLSKFVYSAEKQQYYLSEKDMFDYSDKSNVLLIVLDRLDYSYIQSISETDPDFFNTLDGFTCYTNTTAEFGRTIPGLNHLLTGCEGGAYLSSINEYLDASWTSVSDKSIIEELDEQGYSVQLYGDINDLMSQNNQLINKISNIGENALNINHFYLSKAMLRLSASRFAPVIMNTCPDTDFIKSITLDNDKYYLNDSLFYEEMKNGCITTGACEGVFKFIHLQGSHAPYKLNEDGTVSLLATNALTQTKGVFSILFELFRRMKELGIYERSEIIITSDHGDGKDDTKKLQGAVCIGLFHKPSGKAGTALEYNNAPLSQKNIPPTILKAAGAENYADFGLPIDEVNESDSIIRYNYKSIIVGVNEKFVYKYEINGDAKNKENWKEIGSFEGDDKWINGPIAFVCGFVFFRKAAYRLKNIKRRRIKRRFKSSQNERKDIT